MPIRVPVVPMPGDKYIYFARGLVENFRAGCFVVSENVSVIIELIRHIIPVWLFLQELMGRPDSAVSTFSCRGKYNFSASKPSELAAFQRSHIPA